MSNETAQLAERKRPGRPRLYPRVKGQIEQLVRSHNLRPGTPIESEKQLGSRFGVSRSLVRKALAELVREQRIVTVPGKGHYVADPTRRAVEAGAVVCVLGSTRADAAWWDYHLGGIVAGVDQVMQNSPHRLLWEQVGARRRTAAEMVKPHLSDLIGLIVVPLVDQSVAHYLDSAPAGVAKVVAGRPAGAFDVPCVYVNHRKGMAQATDYLLGQGHRQIGYVDQVTRSWPSVERLEGHRQALEAHGHEPPGEDRLVAVAQRGEHVEQSIAELLERSPELTALIVSSGWSLPWVLRALHGLGVRVPEDLSLVCYDDVPAGRQHLPAITVVRQPTQQMGSTAGQMLEALLAGEAPSAREVVLECELVVRESVRPLPLTPFSNQHLSPVLERSAS